MLAGEPLFVIETHRVHEPAGSTQTKRQLPALTGPDCRLIGVEADADAPRQSPGYAGDGFRPQEKTLAPVAGLRQAYHATHRIHGLGAIHRRAALKRCGLTEQCHQYAKRQPAGQLAPTR